MQSFEVGRVIRNPPRKPCGSVLEVAPKTANRAWPDCSQAEFFKQLLDGQTVMCGHRFEDTADQRAGFERFVIGHRDMMDAPAPRLRYRVKTFFLRGHGSGTLALLCV